MSKTLWDTTGSAVVEALQAERRQSGAVSVGLALSLVVVTDEKELQTAEEAVAAAAAEHPCRVLVVIRRSFKADDRLDAEVSVGGRLGPGESVVLRMYGRLSLHAESVVLPLLAPDAPIVTWVHGPPPETLAHDPLAVLADRRVTDCSRADDPVAALLQRAGDYAPGDTDLAWTRTTRWRALTATAFDTGLPRVLGGRVTSEPGDPSANLVAGWIQARLGVDISVEESSGPALTGVSLDLDPDEVAEALAEDPGKGAGRDQDADADGDSDGDPAPVLEIVRRDGSSAVLRRPGRPDRQLPIPRRELGDLLAEELRRLDADEPYADALGEAAGLEGLSDRPAARRHEWRDPAEEARAEEARAADEARSGADG